MDSGKKEKIEMIAIVSGIVTVFVLAIIMNVVSETLPILF